jgi:hypothetical protein
LIYWSLARRRTVENPSVLGYIADRIIHGNLEQLVDTVEMFTVLIFLKGKE